MTKTDRERQSWLFKHYMTERDFEVEHAVDNDYHDVEPHYHEFYEMYFFAGGHVDYIVDDQQFQLHPGDLLYTGDGDSHSIRNDGDATLRFVALILFK